MYPGFPKTLLEDPVLVSIAAAHKRQPAEVALAWQTQMGIVVNPRTQNAEHMWQNLHFADIVLTDAEMAQLGARPQY